MQQTPRGTAVGVDDPYQHVERCDHLTDDGRCRFAILYPNEDQSFATARHEDSYRCHVGADREWATCRHFRSRSQEKTCTRCGLQEHLVAHDESVRPLLEEHHLSYAGEGRDHSHEITVMLCRWCHAKVHNSWGRIDDAASPDPEAIAEREQRRAAEIQETGFAPATDRFSQ